MTDPKKLKMPHGHEKKGKHCRTDFPGWKKIPLGGVITEPGSSTKYDTGNWTRQTCKWKKETCINCNLCWPVCPHDAIKVDKDGNMAGVDESKCTACTLCVSACPTNPKSLEIVNKKKASI